MQEQLDESVKVQNELKKQLEMLQLKTETSYAHAVSIKPPDFSEANPATFFTILEAQFELKNISLSQTKFYHAITAIPHTILNTITESIIQKKDYNELKDAVLTTYEKSKPEMFEKLISKTVMTGKPSLFLIELTKIAAKIGVCEELLRHKFVQNLPSTIAPVIASQKNLSLTDLGIMADDLMLLHKNMDVNLAQASHVTTTREHQSRTQYTPNYTGIPIGLKPFHNDQKPKICRSHIYFGEKSRTCTRWCKFPNKRNCQIWSSRPGSPASTRSRNASTSSRSSSPTRSEN